MSNDQNDRAWASYTRAFRRHVMPKLLSSRVMLGMYDGGGDGVGEVRLATTIGMSLLRKIPIVLLIPEGLEIPTRLRLAASIVITDADMTSPETQERLVAAFKQLDSDVGS